MPDFTTFLSLLRVSLPLLSYIVIKQIRLSLACWKPANGNHIIVGRCNSCKCEETNKAVVKQDYLYWKIFRLYVILST